MSTKRVALIGFPLRRRHSVVMHNAAFDHFGVDAHYELRELEPSGLDGFFAEARGPEWLGFQITAPYKREAVRRCDEVEALARAIGAVNSVLRRGDGALVGFNTDALGFARSVQEDLGRELAGATVAMAGAGGAARAVTAACLEAGAERVVVGARSRESARALVREFEGADRVESEMLGPPFEARLSEADLAVNATTVGMTSPGMPFDPSALAAGSAVFDLVYEPPVTDLIDQARRLGLQAVNGLGMLVAQAELAFHRWTGVEGAGSVMRAALES